MCSSHSPLSFGVELQVALLSSLLNGKIFMEWICPAVAKLYQLHVTVSMKL